MSRGEAAFSRAILWAVLVSSFSGTNVCPSEEASLGGDGGIGQREVASKWKGLLDTTLPPTIRPPLGAHNFGIWNCKTSRRLPEAIYGADKAVTVPGCSSPFVYLDKNTVLFRNVQHNCTVCTPLPS